MSRNMEKAKDIVLFVIRSAIFLFIAKRFLIGFLIISFILIRILGDFASLLFCWIPYYIYILLMYFTAKKLGIIKVLDSLPWHWLIVVLFVFEVVLTLSRPINLSNEPFLEYLRHYYRLMISNTFGYLIAGFGFIYTFIAYKTVRFLLNRFPNKLAWLKRFYPSKLEETISFRNIRSIIDRICKNK